MDSAPAKQLYLKMCPTKKRKSSSKLHLPWTVIYLKSICNGIVIISGSGTEAYSLFIQTLQYQINKKGCHQQDNKASHRKWYI